MKGELPVILKQDRYQVMNEYSTSRCLASVSSNQLNKNDQDDQAFYSFYFTIKLCSLNSTCYPAGFVHLRIFKGLPRTINI